MAHQLTRIESVDPRDYMRPGDPTNWRVELMVRRGGSFDRKVYEVQPGIGKENDRSHAVSVATRMAGAAWMPTGSVILVSAQRNREIVRKVIV